MGENDRGRTEGDQGFTLIELLVVIAIIATLAGIALPVFLSQRTKGVDASLRSDLKSLATAAETYATDNVEATVYGTATPPTDASVTDALGSTSPVNFRRSPGNTVQIKGDPLNGYCLRSRNDNGSMKSAMTYFYFDSKNGGLLTNGPVATVAGGACGTAGTWYTVS